jgi:hypothetical protein
MASSLENVAVAPRYTTSAAAAVASSAALPWYLYAVAVAATSVVVGVIWDISWHMTIGRDTFWTPAHMCTYLAAAIVGITCGYVALKTTFAGTPDERARSMSFWGFRAPLGAWICVWGSFAMLTSAPFDDWWHNAYGLDVKIISPPHTLLILGMVSIVIGAMVWTLAWQNRVQDTALKRRLERLFVYDAGLLVSMGGIFIYEYTNRVRMHDTLLYRVAAIMFPLLLLASARGSTMRWPATTASLVYMGVRIVMGWILPLWSAEPKLGPIYNPIDHMAAMQFPLLLVVPGVAIDLLMQRLGKDGSARRDWATAPLYGAVFVAALLIVQWPFASFLLSPAARNWFFFVGRDMSYGVPPTSRLWNNQFIRNPAEATTAMVAKGLCFALIFATLSSRLGLAWGRWMKQVRR